VSKSGLLEVSDEPTEAWPRNMPERLEAVTYDALQRMWVVIWKGACAGAPHMMKIELRAL